MEDKKYTIKDIARLAGVSAGTVDRVLHNRGEVSEVSRRKVRKVLDEINYQPNMFAIGLAAKKHYTIFCLIPFFQENDYWYSVFTGIRKAATEWRAFNVGVEYLYYKHDDKESYRNAAKELLEKEADAVLIAPNYRTETLQLTQELSLRNISFTFIDFNVEGTEMLTYIGQDSHKSGYLAAKILMGEYKPDKELVLFFNNFLLNPFEVQMQRRLNGFMQFINRFYPGLKIHEIMLDREDNRMNKERLEQFFKAHPAADFGVVFNSRVYQVGEILRELDIQMTGLIGYDLLPKNVQLLKSGEIRYLIGQRPGLQGYYGIKALCDHILFKKEVDPIIYMPIDILMKENIDYYFEHI